MLEEPSPWFEIGHNPGLTTGETTSSAGISTSLALGVEQPLFYSLDKTNAILVNVC